MKARYWLVSAALIVVSAVAQAAPADLSLYVFKQGQPVSGVMVSLGDQSIGTTGSDGAIRATIDPGKYRLALAKAGESLHQRTLRLVEDEVIQIIVTLFADDRPVFVDIETSDPEKGRAVAAQSGPDKTGGPPGQIRGQVLNAENGEFIQGARVFVSGVKDEVVTGEGGKFSFDLPPGEYSLSVLAPGFNTRTVDGLPVEPEKLTQRNFELTPEGTELPEFVVTEPYISGSLASVLEERRMQDAVANLLGSEQISRSGDSTAASALKRVTGLTLVGGQFIYVRGLGERYSSTLVNESRVPSPDPTRRVVPLDLFPAGIIDSIAVQKSYTHGQPAEFGGGTVEIRTKAIPEKRFLSVELSSGANLQTTLQDGLEADGGGLDWLGFDDGSRAVPELLAEATAGGTELRESNPILPGGFSAEELERIGESIPQQFDITETTVIPDAGLSLTAGTPFEFGADWSGGLLTAFSWDQTWENRNDEVRRDFNISSEGLVLDREEFFDETQRSVDLSLYSTGKLSYRDNHSLGVNWMWLRSSEEEIRVSRGFNEDRQNRFRFDRIEWEERALRNLQFIGEHIFPSLSNIKLDWNVSRGTARQDIPFFREFRFDEIGDDQFQFSQRNDSNAFRWENVEDDAFSWQVDAALPLQLFSSTELTLIGGISRVNKSRNAAIRRFNFVGDPDDNTIRRRESLEDIITDDTIGPGQFRFVEVTRETDTYFADRQVDALHGGIDLDVEDWFRLSGGVRVEDFTQDVTTFELFSPDATEVTSTLESDDVFPSAALTVFLPWNQEVRLAWGETAIRPDFRETSEQRFTDPVLDRVVRGNPDLVDGEITHYDLRWDKYFSPTDFVSVGAFYKDFTRPIEIFIRPGTDNIVSFQNAASAENFGFEAEVFKKLGFIDEFWQPFYINANFAYIESEVQLQDDTGGVTNLNRSLQGQSPFVINTQLGYDNEALGINAAILYNIAGARISEASTSGRPDIFEQPFQQLDLVYRHALGQWQLKFKLQNILDDEVQFTQSDRTTRSFKPGRELSVGVEYTWE